MTHLRFALASCVVLALAGAAGVVVGEIAGLKPRPALEWSLPLLALAGACVIAVQVLARRAYQSKDILSALADSRAAVEALRQEKSRAEEVLSEVADGIIIVGGEGEVTLFNRAAEEMFGARALRARSQSVEAAEFHPEIARLAADCIAGKGVLSSEVRLPGVPEKTIGIRAAPFSGSQAGRVALLLLHDLSEIRRHEKMQKEFVSNVSHELRTPITAVRATAEALLAGAKNDEDLVDRFLNTIVAESDRLSALIDDLMDLAKRDSGVTRMEKSEVSVQEAISRAFAPVRPLAEQQQVTVTFEVPEGIVIRADEIQLVQLVRNLLDNAVKYTPAGGCVNVSASLAGGEAAISVCDTGIGIPHGEVDRVFERFYRVDKARSRRLGGTGLGLAIVKDIVEAHGGRIEVDTQLGRGSTFTVRLPAGVDGL